MRDVDLKPLKIPGARGGLKTTFKVEAKPLSAKLYIDPLYDQVNGPMTNVLWAQNAPRVFESSPNTNTTKSGRHFASGSSPGNASPSGRRASPEGSMHHPGSAPSKSGKGGYLSSPVRSMGESPMVQSRPEGSPKKQASAKKKRMMMLAKGGDVPPKLLPGSAIYKALPIPYNTWSPKRPIPGVSQTSIGCCILASQDTLLRNLHAPRQDSRSRSISPQGRSPASFLSRTPTPALQRQSSVSEWWTRSRSAKGRDSAIAAEADAFEGTAERPRELLVLHPEAAEEGQAVVWCEKTQTFGLQKIEAQSAARPGSGKDGGRMSVGGEAVPVEEEAEQEGEAEAEARDEDGEWGEEESFAEAMREKLENAYKKEEKRTRIQLHFNRVVAVLKSSKITTIAELRAMMIRYCRDEHLAQNALIGIEIALHKNNQLGSFFERILPDMMARGSRILQFFEGGEVVPLQPDADGRVILSRPQCACLISLMFLCALPNNQMSFSSLLYSQQSYQVAKLQFFLNYFDRISNYLPDEPPGFVTITKNVLPYERYDWGGSKEPLMPFRVQSRSEICDNLEALQVDFAHAEIGGGLLFRGCGEEEMRFCMAPELSLACLVCSRMMPNEAVIVSGAERFSKATGKGYMMQFGGNHVDTTPKGPDASILSCMVCIDPSRFDKFQEKLMRLQMSRQVMQRECDKAVSGFWQTADTNRYISVATGRWGSGVMHGDPEVKVLVQWIAASECAREIDYHIAYEVKERKFIQRLREFVTQMLKDEVTVGQLWDACQDLADYDVKSGSLFESITSLIQGWREQEREMEAERAEEMGDSAAPTPTGSFRGGRSPAASGIIPAKPGGANKRNLRALTLRNLELDGKMQASFKSFSPFTTVSSQTSGVPAVSPSDSKEHVAASIGDGGVAKEDAPTVPAEVSSYRRGTI